MDLFAVTILTRNRLLGDIDLRVKKLALWEPRGLGRKQFQKRRRGVKINTFFSLVWCREVRHQQVITTDYRQIKEIAVGPREVAGIKNHFVSELDQGRISEFGASSCPCSRLLESFFVRTYRTNLTFTFWYLREARAYFIHWRRFSLWFFAIAYFRSTFACTSMNL